MKFVLLNWLQSYFQFLLFVSECEEFNYGPNCGRSCGHCHNDDPCDKKTGVCQNGCIAGWRGQHCNECMYRMILHGYIIMRNKPDARSTWSQRWNNRPYYCSNISTNEMIFTFLSMKTWSNRFHCSELLLGLIYQDAGMLAL